MSVFEDTAYAVADDSDGTETVTAHTLGSINAKVGKLGRVGVGTYQWLIVVGAVAALYGLHFVLKSGSLKVG